MKYLGYILVLAWFYMILRYKVTLDYLQWKQGFQVDHVKEWTDFVIQLMPCYLGLAMMKYRNDISFGRAIRILIISAVLVASLWWLAFDGWFNTIRGFGFWFNGSVGSHDTSDYDKILRLLPDWGEAGLKISLIVTSIIFYIKK